MNIRIDSNFQFAVVSIKYEPCGGLCITLQSDVFSSEWSLRVKKSLDKRQELAKKMYICIWNEPRVT